MEDKLEVGMYVRTLGGINKVIEVKDNGVMARFVNEDGNVYFINDMMCNPSHNIIDLIKPKDIILGNDGKLYQCWKVYKDYVFTYSKNKQGQTITLVDYQIDRVMCYEQFESISYKLGDDK